ncbi:hypothetical protein [Paenibacillus baekrokdamisoli]|uniref:hypothetical protein n=1 Tax=Paenibacillus baekrokdamisoli TaxID=1712516 RepID=UPI001C865117|nr:hypothetical protein [Paenibacillus baekrokdamisoli]
MRSGSCKVIVGIKTLKQASGIIQMPVFVCVNEAFYGLSFTILYIVIDVEKTLLD